MSLTIDGVQEETGEDGVEDSSSSYTQGDSGTDII